MYTKLVIKLIIRILFTGIIIFFNSYQLFAQLQYNFERINTDNGLPTNAIKGLQFDEKTRFLWVATESGIVRYNGHGFQSFGDNIDNAALNGRINFFVKSYDGTLFGKLVDGKAFRIQDNKAFIDKKFNKIIVEDDYLKYKYKKIPKIYNSNLIDIDLSDFVYHNKIYATYDYILYEYENGFKPVEKIKNEKSPFLIKGQLYFLDNKGVIFSATIKNSQLFKLNQVNLFELLNIKNNGFFQFKVFQNHPSEPIFLTYGQKMYSIKQIDEKLQFELVTDQLPEVDFIKFIQVDQVTNTIYIGTDNRGLIIARPRYFNRILPIKQSAGNSSTAYAQLLLKNGNIQINTGQTFGENAGINPSVFYKISNTATFISKDSLMYFTNSDGIICYDLRKDKIISISNEIHANRNNFFEIDDILYSFNEIGIAYKIKNQKWVYKLKFKSVPSNFIVYDIKAVDGSNLLIATTDGLYKYSIQKNKFSLFFKDKKRANFRSIYKMDSYYLIGTYGSGVYMYRNDTIKQLPLDQNKYLSFTHCFLQDNQKRVWASTNKGLFMSIESSLIDFWHKGPGNIKFTYFGKPDGIDQLELNGGCSPCAIKMPDGRFSFPGIDGLIQFYPNTIINNSIQPSIFIDKLIINGNIIENLDLNSEFDNETKNIEVQLGISGMLTEENIMLEYKFDDESWTRTNVKNSNLKFSNLSFGSHKISVRIRNTIQSKWILFDLPFYIKYPWTLNPIMYLIYILILIGLILLYIRFKTIIYQRRQKLLEIEVNAKTESLNKLNDYLLKRNQAKDHVIAIMNHDILTPLKYMHITAKNIVESNNDQHIKKSIKQIANTTKELEYLTSNMLNWVKFDNIDSLPKKQDFDLHSLVNDLVEFVTPFNENKNVEIINKVPFNTSIYNWQDSLRVLLYNLLVNAIKATSQGSIIIEYQTIKDGYIINIKDTGIGMSPSLVEYLLKGNQEEHKEYHTKYKTGNGVGYQIIRNIVHLMNAIIEIDSIEYKGTNINVIFISH